MLIRGTIAFAPMGWDFQPRIIVVGVALFARRTVLARVCRKEEWPAAALEALEKHGGVNRLTNCAKHLARRLRGMDVVSPEGVLTYLREDREELPEMDGRLRVIELHHVTEEPPAESGYAATLPLEGADTENANAMLEMMFRHALEKPVRPLGFFVEWDLAQEEKAARSPLLHIRRRDL